MMASEKKRFSFGPGTLIAAAFIGPGTVTTCMVAGVNHTYSLMWAMVFSIFATIVLQEMSARIGLVTQKGIAEIIRSETTTTFAKILSGLLIISAIVIGNAAYEAGNISGAVMGKDAITSFNFGFKDFNIFSFIIGGCAFLILYSGSYKIIERWLVWLVVMLSVAFIIAGIAAAPDLKAVLSGMFFPTLPPDKGSIFTVMGIIGTTVVPYNLFLHASLVKKKWNGTNHLSEVRLDLYVSILLGGLVSLMIIIAAASLHGGDATITNGLDMAKSLEPVLGSYSRYLFGIGLFAAGITSAITAPLAAAYVCTELAGKSSDMKSRFFRAVWMSILLIGVILSALGMSPIVIIKYAQFTNGILLPITAGVLLWLINKRSIMTHHRNSIWQNIIGLLILAVTIALGIKSVLAVIEWMGT